MFWWVGYWLMALGASGQTQKERQEADRWLSQAEAAQREQAHVRAVTYLSRVIALDPGRQDAYLLRAQSKERTEAWREALLDYNVYLEWRPAHFEAVWLRAMLLFRLKNWPAAEADLQRLLRLPPGETSHIVFELNPFENAVQRAFTAHQGSRPQVYNALGLVALELGQHPRALRYLDSAIAIQPNYPQAWANRGLVLEKLNRTEEARADLQKALQLDPTLEIAQYNLAVTHQPTPSEEDAHLTALINQNPAIPFPFYERATLRLAQQEYAAALADINAALRIDSLNETYWVTRGMIYEKQHQWRNALRDHTRAIQLNDQNADAWFQHGNAARRLNDRAMALEDYSMAIFIKPDYGNAYYNRAVMYFETGNYTQSCEDVKKAAQLGVAINPRLKQKVCAK